MKAATAIKKFVECSVTEIKEFKESCTDKEWKEFGKQACKAMDIEFEE